MICFRVTFFLGVELGFDLGVFDYEVFVFFIRIFRFRVIVVEWGGGFCIGVSVVMVVYFNVVICYF